jgi:hemoglobin/transferrin/lactoferrin receptor protein
VEKIQLRTGLRTVHQLNIQYSTSSNVPRYDRLSEYSYDARGNIVPEHAEWYYGPQERLLVAYTLELEERPWFDQARITPSMQRITQSRHDRSWGSTLLRKRTEQVNVQGLNAEFEKRVGGHELRYGLEAYGNEVHSTAERQDINSGAVSYLNTRYPDGGSSMATAGVFATHTYEAGERWVLSDGLRFNYVGLNATFANDNAYPFLNGDIQQRNTAVNWRLAAVYQPDSTWRFTALGNTGFRAPNVDDLAKVFDSTPGTVIVPNPDLRPERTLNAELGLRKTLNGRHSAELNAFYTWYTDALVVAPYTVNGQDSILYDGELGQVNAMSNAGKAFITGASASLRIALGQRLNSTSSCTYTYGRVLTDSTTTPLDHIPPVFGKSGLELQLKRFRGEAYVLFNGWKRIADYSDSGEDNQRYATADGMPAWWTLGIRGSFAINAHFLVQAGVENLADRNYRTFASGVSAPGRNVQLSLRATF